MINAGVGIATTVAMTPVGLPSPVLWGVIIAVLGFIPYLGPLVFMALLLLAGTLTFSNFGEIVAPALAYGVINIVESNFIAPWIVGRRLEMSPLFVFLAVMVCAWMWGVAGAFLAVPLLVIIVVLLADKKICGCGASIWTAGGPSCRRCALCSGSG